MTHPIEPGRWYRAIYLPDGVDWSDATPETPLIRAAIFDAIVTETSDTKAKTQDLVLVVSEQEAEQMSRSKEVGMYAEAMPESDDLPVFCMTGIPMKLYGIPVKVTDGTLVKTFSRNGNG